MRDAQNPVRRHVRRIDIWAVTKVSVLFFAVVGIIWLVTALVIWRVLHAFDLVTKVEELTGKLGGGDFRLRGGELLEAFLLIDAVWVIGSTTFVIILAVVYNLITDVVGGITFVVEDKVPKRDTTLIGALRGRMASRREERGERKAEGDMEKKGRARPGTRPAVRPGAKPSPAGKPGARPAEVPVAKAGAPASGTGQPSGSKPSPAPATPAEGTRRRPVRPAALKDKAAAGSASASASRP
ncbi:MAG: hypothetical protein DYH08_18500, partial [Actinobacteria bacterium ATB1]|nr:hypothetical protein [Actinobacteria bacterium ATB1]